MRFLSTWSRKQENRKIQRRTHKKQNKKEKHGFRRASDFKILN